METPFYQIREEDIPSNCNKETVMMFAKKLEPTQEDINRQLTDEELIELCQKVKCRVDAFLWNPVYEYQKFLLKRNRFVGKSPLDQRNLVAKAVNRHKDKMMYDEQEIKKIRRKDWILRKKDNILSLDHWAYQRKHPDGETSETSSQNENIQEDHMESLQIDDSPMVEEHLDETCQRQEIQSQQTPLIPSDLLLSQDEFENIAVVQEECAEDFQSIEADLLNSSDINTEELRERGVNKSIAQMFDVNTESMTVFDSEESSIPNKISQDAQSQEVLVSNNYDDFDNGVPLTSTQSQQKD
ncbi:caravaggio [Haematobia irritans]|uniref:caravaggio n=1 Tax=Haematobia irritans TaxID=7368 RepID=UPI003F4FE7DC